MFLGILWFKYRGKKNFLNSEGEIVQKEKGPGKMIDDEYFDDTVVNGDHTNGDLIDDDTVVQRNAPVNRAVNF